MRITRRQLRQIIQEELGRITEDPDGLVPTDPVGQAASQSASRQASRAELNRGPYDSFRLKAFLTKLDRDQSEYTGQSFMDGNFKEALEIEQDLRGSVGPRYFYFRDVLDNDWSGFFENPPKPFPKARPNVVGQKFAGFARVNPDVLNGSIKEKAELIAKFFSDHKTDSDLT